MAKKKKEVCPYCGKSFAYLSRHKCKIKDHVEGTEESDKSEVERRIKRIEGKKKEFTRSLKKDEKEILKIIEKEKSMFFEDLVNLTGKRRNEVDSILDTLALQSKIKVKRELVEASWTKHIFSIEQIDIKVQDFKIDSKNKEFILEMFSYQPCLICPFTTKCNETNLDRFNPHHCPWLTDWINTSKEGNIYRVDFDEIQSEILD